MKSRLLENFGPALVICVVLPAMAGSWWRYKFEGSTPQAPVQMALHRDAQKLGAFTGYELDTPEQPVCRESSAGRAELSTLPGDYGDSLVATPCKAGD